MRSLFFKWMGFWLWLLVTALSFESAYALSSGRSTGKPEGQIYAYDAAPLVEPVQVTFEERGAQNVFTMQRQGFPQTACCARPTRDSSVGFDGIQLGENAKYEGSYRYGSGRNLPHDLVSQNRKDNAGNFEMSFYSYDGLGSVRGLTDAIGTSLGQYHYDSYGLLIENTVSVANPYLFAGERFDNDLGLYYLRARYLDVETGRFWSLDDFEGNNFEALSLHKYLYAHANPISNVDPSGMETLAGLSRTIGALNSLVSSAFQASRAAFAISRTAGLAANARLGKIAEMAIRVILKRLPGVTNLSKSGNTLMRCARFLDHQIRE